MVKSVTMAELRNARPASPKEIHQSNVGKGEFNRWNILSDPPRRGSLSGKRPLETSLSPPGGTLQSPQTGSERALWANEGPRR